MAKETFNYLTPQGGSGTGMMFPNWNAKQLVMSSSGDTNVSTYTVQNTGYLQGYLNAGDGGVFTLNDVVVDFGSASGASNDSAASFLIPVLSGDVLKLYADGHLTSLDTMQ